MFEKSRKILINNLITIIAILDVFLFDIDST